jgi:fructose-bisphosphate aldolase class II|tara:strand:+ start:4405 stop:5265 length:861 start_codon:yes stop_codon:yes gene_type:complete
MLHNAKDLLGVANENYFAIPAFNISDYSMMKAIFEISEEKQSPVIIAIHPDELAHVGASFLASALDWAHRSKVPVVIHLDHGTTYAHVLKGIQAGFNSAMLDGSTLTFADNVALTKLAVVAGNAVGIAIEGELGTIGKGDEEAEAGTERIIYTKPDEAVEFAKLTGIHSLAVAVGTFHGLYPSSMKPELKLDLLSEIKAKIEIPLVLHGGSNNPDDEISEAVKRGINKINISSDIKVAYYNEMRRVLEDAKVREPNSIQPSCMVAMKEVAAQKMDLFGATGKASLY